MFTLAQWIARLTKGYIRYTGKKPDGLAHLKIKMEAAQRVKDQSKVIKGNFNPKEEWWKARPTTKNRINQIDEELEKLSTGEGKYSKMNRNEREDLMIKLQDESSTLQKEFPEDFASGGIAGELHLNRPGYAKGKEVIEKTILSGPQKSGLPGVDKIIDAIGGAAGISTLGLPKWLLSKLTQGGVRSKLHKKYYQLIKENRLREARQLLTARDPYIGEDPEMSEAKRTMRKYTRRMPTEEEEEFRLSPEMIEEGWRYPGRGGRGVPHERTARNKRGYANGGLAKILGV